MLHAVELHHCPGKRGVRWAQARVRQPVGVVKERRRNDGAGRGRRREQPAWTDTQPQATYAKCATQSLNARFSYVIKARCVVSAPTAAGKAAEDEEEGGEEEEVTEEEEEDRRNIPSTSRRMLADTGSPTAAMTVNNSTAAATP